MLKEKLSVTFIELRDLAIEMEVEDSLHKRCPGRRTAAILSTEAEFGWALETLSTALLNQTKVLQGTKVQQTKLAACMDNLERAQSVGRLPQTTRNRSTVQCYRCRQNGHYATECMTALPAPQTARNLGDWVPPAP